MRLKTLEIMRATEEWVPAYEPLRPRVDPPARKGYVRHLYTSRLAVEFDHFNPLHEAGSYGTNNPIVCHAEMQHDPLAADVYRDNDGYRDHIERELWRMVMRETQIIQGR